MKIIFCDIDGVLNSDYFRRKHNQYFLEIEERKVNNLKKAVSITGAEVVIVSHGNSFFGKEYSQKRLDMIKRYGVSPIATLESKEMLLSKEELVEQWLKGNQITKFVIFDDCNDNYSTLSPFLILVQGKHGLTYRHINKAIEMLE